MLMTMELMAISMVMIDDNDVNNKFDHGESKVKVMVVMKVLFVMEVMMMMMITAVQWADYVSLRILYFLLLTCKRLNVWFWASVCSVI